MPSDRPTVVPVEIADYVRARCSGPDPVLNQLRVRTALLGVAAGMQVSPEVGKCLEIVSQIVAPNLAFEVGTFTGYSSICLARGLVSGGRLITCDIDARPTLIAREFWQTAEVADRIDLRVGDALQVLDELPTSTSIDLAFIDGRKVEYLAYYEAVVARLRVGGVAIVDNTLWWGRVIRSDSRDEITMAMKLFNDYVAHDVRVNSVILPVSDGLTIARKR